MGRGEATTIDDQQPVVTFESFFELAWPKLVGLAFLLGRDRSAAPDIAQEVLAGMQRRWTDIEHPYAYAHAAIRNAVAARQRKVGSRELGPLDETAAASSVDADSSDAVLDRLEVRRLLTILSTTDFELVVLRYYAGLSDSEIAAALSMRLGTVKSRLRRALAHIRKEASR